MNIIILSIIAIVVLAALTKGFTDFFVYGVKNRTKFCDRCHRRTKLTDLKKLGSGVNLVFKCRHCGYTQTVYDDLRY